MSVPDDWEKIKEEVFFHDGSWRDIYAFDVGPEGWRKLLPALPRSNWGYRYTWEGDEATLPTTYDEARSKIGNALLTIDPAGLMVNCHFFSYDDIEFDIRPNEVSYVAAYRRVLEFMQWFADSVASVVVLTPENMRDVVFFEIKPQARQS